MNGVFRSKKNEFKMKQKENMLLGTICNDKFSKKAEYINKGQTMIKNKLSESNHAMNKKIMMLEGNIKTTNDSLIC